MGMADHSVVCVALQQQLQHIHQLPFDGVIVVHYQGLGHVLQEQVLPRLLLIAEHVTPNDGWLLVRSLP